VRISIRVKPNANRIGRAQEFAIADLKTARVARVYGIVAQIEVTVDAGDGASDFARNGAGLLRDHAHAQDAVLRVGRNKSQVFSGPVNLQNVDGPRHAGDLLVRIANPWLGLWGSRAGRGARGRSRRQMCGENGDADED